MTRFRLAFAAVASMTIAGCSSELATTVSCTESLTGAFTTTMSCPAATGQWDVASNLGMVSIAAPSEMTLTVSIAFTGEPQLRSYTIADLGVALGGVSLQQGQYFAGQGFVPSGHVFTAGSDTLTLTSVSQATTTANDNTYTVHGTLDATMIGSTGGSTGTVPNVVLHATF